MLSYLKAVWRHERQPLKVKYSPQLHLVDIIFVRFDPREVLIISRRIFVSLGRYDGVFSQVVSKGLQESSTSTWKIDFRGLFCHEVDELDRTPMMWFFTRPASQVFDVERRRVPCSTGHCRPCSGSSNKSRQRGCARNERARSTDQVQPVRLSSVRPSRQWWQLLPQRLEVPPTVASPVLRWHYSDCPPPRWRSPLVARPSGLWRISLCSSSSSTISKSASTRFWPVCCWWPCSCPTSSGCRDYRWARSRSRTRGSLWRRPSCFSSFADSQHWTGFKEERVRTSVRALSRLGMNRADRRANCTSTRTWNSRKSVFFTKLLREKIEDRYTYDVGCMRSFLSCFGTKR